MSLRSHEPLQRLGLTEAQLEAFCAKWKVRELALFGSVLREDFRPDSDVDVMVVFAEDACWGLFEFSAMADELESLLSRHVDLLTRRGVEDSRNPLRKKAILESAQVIYAA